MQAGTPFLLRLPVGDSDLQITTPAGKKEQLKVATSPLVFTDTLEAGLYSYKSASREGRFAVNLFDESESQIASRLNMSAANARRKGSGRPRSDGKRIFSLALIAGRRTHLARSGIFLGFSYGSFRSILSSLGAVALAALVLALVNPRIFKTTNALDVVLGVDLSRSVGQEGREKAREILEAASRIQEPGDAHGASDVWPLAGMGVSPAPRLPGGGFRLPLGPRRDRYPGGVASRACANGRGSSGQNSFALRRQ